MAMDSALRTRETASGNAGRRRRRRSPDEIRGLLLASAREEFNRFGYAGARTAAIARNADVTEAQLFRYYDSKAALFKDAVFEPLNRHFSEFNTRQLSDALATSGHREMERRYIAEFHRFLQEHAPLLLSLMVAETHSSDDTRSLAEIDSLRSYFDRGAAMMAARVGRNAPVDPELMVRVSFASVLGCVLFRDWLFRGTSAGADEVDNAIMAFVLDGINANNGTNGGATGGKVDE